jgi:hypothetical protein
VKPFPHPPKREEKEIARTHPEPDHPPTESDLHLLPLCPLFLFFFFPPFLLPSLPAPNPSLPTGNPTERKKPKTKRKKKKKRKEKEKKKKKTKTKKATIEPNERRPDPFLIRTTFPSFWTPHHLLRSVSLTNARLTMCFLFQKHPEHAVSRSFLD